MFFNPFDWITSIKAWILALLVALGLCSGCAGWKAVDSTRAVEAISSAEAGSPMVVPGYLTGNPQLADKLLLINAPGGKNIRATFRYPDGTIAAEVDSSRSAVTDALLASIAGLDAGKYAEDARREAAFSALLDKLLAYLPVPGATSAGLTSMMDASIAKRVNPPAEPSRLERMQAWAAGAKEFTAEERDAILKMFATPTPTP